MVGVCVNRIGKLVSLIILISMILLYIGLMDYLGLSFPKSIWSMDELFTLKWLKLYLVWSVSIGVIAIIGVKFLWLLSLVLWGRYSIKTDVRFDWSFEGTRKKKHTDQQWD